MEAVCENPPGHIAETRELGRGDRVFEFMMNALRLNQGFDLRLFEARTGLSIAAAGPGWRKRNAGACWSENCTTRVPARPAGASSTSCCRCSSERL